MSTTPDITHIIPACNEEIFLPRTLESVKRAASLFRGSVEIIVVDNASEDRTAEIAAAAGATVVFESNRCIAAARNKGAALASGEILTFADADSIVSENFFVEAHRLLASGKYVGGNFAIHADRSSLGIFLTINVVLLIIRAVFRVGGGSYFCHRKVFEEIGGFDIALDYSEDVAFARALRLYGKKRQLAYVQSKTAHVVTSMRKSDTFGDWHFFKLLLKLPFLAISPKRLKKTMHAYFYDFDKSKPSKGFH